MTSQLRMQPTFQVTLPWDIEEAKSRLRKAIASKEMIPGAEAAGSVLDYKVAPEDRRFWSPHLSVQLQRCEAPDATEAFCRFSPRPEIWTMVMAIYMVAACCLLGALIFGFVQWMLGTTPWSLAVVPVSVAVIVCLHMSSLIGQGLSHDQMELLRSRWDHTVEVAKQLSDTPDANKVSGLFSGTHQPS